MKIRNKISLLLALLTAITAWLSMSFIGFAWDAGQGGP